MADGPGDPWNESWTTVSDRTDGLIERVDGLTKSHEILIRGLHNVALSISINTEMLKKVLRAVDPAQAPDESGLERLLATLAASAEQHTEGLARIEAAFGRLEKAVEAGQRV